MGPALRLKLLAPLVEVLGEQVHRLVLHMMRRLPLRLIVQNLTYLIHLNVTRVAHQRICNGRGQLCVGALPG